MDTGRQVGDARRGGVPGARVDLVRPGATDEQEDLLLLGHPLALGAGPVRVEAVVLEEHLDLAAVDAAGAVDRVEVDADRPLEGLLRDRGRAGDGGVHADLDGGVGDAGGVASGRRSSRPRRRSRCAVAAGAARAAGRRRCPSRCRRRSRPAAAGRRRRGCRRRPRSGRRRGRPSAPTAGAGTPPRRRPAHRTPAKVPATPAFWPHPVVTASAATIMHDGGCAARDCCVRSSPDPRDGLGAGEPEPFECPAHAVLGRARRRLGVGAEREHRQVGEAERERERAGRRPWAARSTTGRTTAGAATGTVAAATGSVVSADPESTGDRARPGRPGGAERARRDRAARRTAPAPKPDDEPATGPAPAVPPVEVVPVTRRQVLPDEADALVGQPGERHLEGVRRVGALDEHERRGAGGALGEPRATRAWSGRRSTGPSRPARRRPGRGRSRRSACRPSVRRVPSAQNASVTGQARIFADSALALAPGEADSWRTTLADSTSDPGFAASTQLDAPRPCRARRRSPPRGGGRPGCSAGSAGDRRRGRSRPAAGWPPTTSRPWSPHRRASSPVPASRKRGRRRRGRRWCRESAASMSTTAGLCRAMELLRSEGLPPGTSTTKAAAEVTWLTSGSADGPAPVRCWSGLVRFADLSAVRRSRERPGPLGPRMCR